MHIRNMIILMPLLLLVLWALAGCDEDPETECGAARPAEDGSCPLTLRFEPEEMQQTATRAADENAIRDLNIWACGTGIGRDVHLYIPDGKTATTLALIPDNYHFYAVANAGHDLGEMNEAALKTLAASFSGEPGTGEAIPMAARGELHISGPASLTLRMERLISKLSLTLSVASALQGALTVESVQLLSIPSRCLYFADNRASDPSQRTDYSAQSVSGTSFSREYYLPENMAGTNASITSERQKDKAHAPSGASWLRIKARHADRPVTYSVYLGANNTTDFNVERNTLHHLNITLSGSEPSDLRVSRFSLALGTPAASYLPLDKVSVPLTFTAENQTGNSFTLRCALSQGRGRVLLDGVDITSTSVSLPSTGSSPDAYLRALGLRAAGGLHTDGLGRRRAAGKSEPLDLHQAQRRIEALDDGAGQRNGRFPKYFPHHRFGRELRRNIPPETVDRHDFLYRLVQLSGQADHTRCPGRIHGVRGYT